MRIVKFTKDVLDIDAAATAAEIAEAIRTHVSTLKRRGIVVGLSGGIDSSVVTALAVRALGPDRVHVLLMPERDSSPEALTLGRLLTDQLKVPTTVEDIAPTLAAAGCYARQEEAIKTMFPEYGPGTSGRSRCRRFSRRTA